MTCLNDHLAELPADATTSEKTLNAAVDTYRQTAKTSADQARLQTALVAVEEIDSLEDYLKRDDFKSKIQNGLYTIGYERKKVTNQYTDGVATVYRRKNLDDSVDVLSVVNKYENWLARSRRNLNCSGLTEKARRHYKELKFEGNNLAQYLRCETEENADKVCEAIAIFAGKKTAFKGVLMNLVHLGQFTGGVFLCFGSLLFALNKDIPSALSTGVIGVKTLKEYNFGPSPSYMIDAINEIPRHFKSMQTEALKDAFYVPACGLPAHEIYMLPAKTEERL
jgi:hypothetical protein